MNPGDRLDTLPLADRATAGAPGVRRRRGRAGGGGVGPGLGAGADEPGADDPPASRRAGGRRPARCHAGKRRAAALPRARAGRAAGLLRGAAQGSGTYSVRRVATCSRSRRPPRWPGRFAGESPRLGRVLLGCALGDGGDPRRRHRAARDPGRRSRIRGSRRLRAFPHGRPPQGRHRRRSDPGPRTEAPLPPLTGPSMPDRYSLPKAIGWSIAFVVLTFTLFGLLSLRGRDPDHRLDGTGDRVAGSDRARPVAAPGCGHASQYGLLHLAHRDAGAAPDAGGPSLHGWIAARRDSPPACMAGAVTAGTALAVAVVLGAAQWTRDQGTVLDYVQTAATTILVLAPAALERGGAVPRRAAAPAGEGARARHRDRPRRRAVRARACGQPERHARSRSGTSPWPASSSVSPSTRPAASGRRGARTWAGTPLLAALDAPVSGVPFRIPLLDYAPGDPAWLTGGRFGPEGGLASTLALTIAVLVARRWAGGRNTT